MLLFKSVDYGRMAEILVQRAGSQDEFTRLTAITWVSMLIRMLLVHHLILLCIDRYSSLCCDGFWCKQYARVLTCQICLNRLFCAMQINEFVKLGGDQLVPYYADILGAILPCISDKEEKIRVVSGNGSLFLLYILCAVIRLIYVNFYCILHTIMCF